jgi:predicted metal-dependent HD superfamily phosphohydrolase
MQSELITQAREYARQIFQDKAFEKRSFHNFEHTSDVVKAVEEIGAQSQLTSDEMESAIIAGWLHDIGYIDGAEEHERKAADKAKDLLTSAGAEPRQIAEVVEAIMATKVPQQPRSLVAKVVCDADLYHLSLDNAEEHSRKLREEWEALGVKTLSDEEWSSMNLDFMENHRYHTPYGRSVLQDRKKKNVKKLKKLSRPEHEAAKNEALEDEVIKLRSKLEKAKLLKPDRGIETMFRTTSHNHLMLSQMADNKANILITINSIILSIVLSVLMRKLEENPRLVIPTIILITVCLSTTVFAILSTRPNLSSGRFTRDDIKGKKTNLLFFGNFHGMSVDDYEWSMKEMMKDADYLYGSLIKDIYFLGIVLGKKYKFLRIAYNIFMFGFVVAVLAFIIAVIATPKV